MGATTPGAFGIIVYEPTRVADQGSCSSGSIERSAPPEDLCSLSTSTSSAYQIRTAGMTCSRFSKTGPRTCTRSCATRPRATRC